MSVFKTIIANNSKTREQRVGNTIYMPLSCLPPSFRTAHLPHIPNNHAHYHSNTVNGQEDFQPCFVMEDYKHGNMLVARKSGIWSVSGLFDLMEGHFGDGEADLSRLAATYIDNDPQLAQEFISAYVSQRPPRPGFAERFPLYMLLDRLIIWSFCQQNGLVFWNEQWTFRDWAGQYVLFKPAIDIL
jgi:hypothetical protein